MSKRARIPAPFRRLFPAIIRPFDPRVILLVGGCAALLLLGGGSYLLSHITGLPDLPQPRLKTHAESTTAGAPADSEVLSTTIVDPTAPQKSTTSSSNGSTPFGSPTSSGLTPPAAVSTQPSFDITVNAAAIQSHPNLLGAVSGLDVLVSVTRHGGLSTPILLDTISITSSSKLSQLIKVRSAIMTDVNHGIITLMPVGVFPHDITITISATSGPASATTTFPYHIPDTF